MKDFRTALIVAVIVGVGLSDARAASKRPEPCAPSIGRCPVTGCSAHPNDPNAPLDRELNSRKNRTLAQVPAAHLGPYDVNKFLDPHTLPTHNSTRDPKDLRSTWLNSDHAATAVRAMEGHRVALIGYILRAKHGDAESCNCAIATSDVVDTHLNIVQDADTETNPSDLLRESVIVEITHRIRDDAWTLSTLNAMALATQNGQAKPRIMIIGALTYDNLHADMRKKGTRGTLWEVHPITEIDVEVNKKWIPFTATHRPHATGIMHMLMAPQQTLTVAPGQTLQFSNSRNVHWSREQVRALDARMEVDDS